MYTWDKHLPILRDITVAIACMTVVKYVIRGYEYLLCIISSDDVRTSYTVFSVGCVSMNAYILCIVFFLVITEIAFSIALVNGTIHKVLDCILPWLVVEAFFVMCEILITLLYCTKPHPNALRIIIYILGCVVQSIIWGIVCFMFDLQRKEKRSSTDSE